MLAAWSLLSGLLSHKYLVKCHYNVVQFIAILHTSCYVISYLAHIIMASHSIRVAVKDDLFISPTQWSCWGGIWFHSVRRSVPHPVSHICAGKSPVNSPHKATRPTNQSFDVVFDLCQNKRLSKQSWGWWFETPSRSLWHHRNGWCTGIARSLTGILSISIWQAIFWEGRCIQHSLVQC